MYAMLVEQRSETWARMRHDLSRNISWMLRDARPSIHDSVYVQLYYMVEVLLLLARDVRA